MQYCKTIGVLEPSYVIRKYLDSSRIVNLAHYLQQLLIRKLGNEDHTTLLINCFAKLKDDAALSRLTSQAPEFDVDTAITVLRRARFYDHAGRIAAAHSRCDSYFQIQMHDRKDFAAALDFLKEKVPEADRLAALIKYGRLLVVNDRKGTTELAKEVTCRFLRDPGFFTMTSLTDSCVLDPMMASSSFADFVIEDLLNIFVHDNDAMAELIDHVITREPTRTPPGFYATILDLLMRTYSSKTSSDAERQDASDKVMRILESKDPNYDVEQALLLCSANSFDAGRLFLLRKSKRFRNLLLHFMDRGDADNVIQCCEDYGDVDPQLWVEAVWFFRDHEGSSERQVARVLEEVERRHLMQAMTVIDILSQNEKLTLACLRDYMTRFLAAESAITAENDKVILQDKDETERTKQVIHAMQSQPQTFQAAKCSVCAKSLDVPSVHFYCGHSYHHSCFEGYLPEQDSECPICLPDNLILLNEFQQRKSVKDLSAKLREQLRRPDADVMTVVASFLSKAPFASSQEPK